MAENSSANYYERRERQERGLAESAPTPAVRKIHATLAQSYARLAVAGGDPKSAARLHLVEE